MKNNDFITANEVSGAGMKGSCETGGMNKMSETLTREYLMKNITGENISLKNFINDLEKMIIHYALQLTNGNQKNASRILGVKETALSEKIKKFNLKKERKKILLNLDVLDMKEGEINTGLFS